MKEKKLLKKVAPPPPKRKPYDYEQNFKVFSDNMSLLALNAYEIYCITEHMANECLQRDQSITNIQRQNDSISKSLANIDMMINKLMESI